MHADSISGAIPDSVKEDQDVRRESGSAEATPTETCERACEPPGLSFLFLHYDLSTLVNLFSWDIFHCLFAAVELSGHNILIMENIKLHVSLVMRELGLLFPIPRKCILYIKIKQVISST